ncbi:hypothetical protein [Streptomyces sp. Root369]|uniref:hypothetical protein n=1 Tax=Streptomyces sp. Root369 TaxID=1736523 RepID=UPI000AD74AE0|nr:hypothetical protein [Streptomyces sp. Root369]
MHLGDAEPITDPSLGRFRAACDPILDSFRAEFRAQVTEPEDTMGLYAAMAGRRSVSLM